MTSKRLPPLESLRFLEAAVRHGNFSGAADELGVTPAAVSLRVRNLEADLAIALFRRSGPRVEPTEAAIDLSRSVSQGLGFIRGALETYAEKVTSLRVTCVPTLGARWLAPRLPKYHLRAEAVRIELDLSPDLRKSDEFDIAIRTGAETWPEYQVEALAPVDATPLLSPDLAKSIELRRPEDLLRLPLLDHDDWSRWFLQAGTESIAPHYYLDDYSTHDLDATAAIEGVGVALLSLWLFRGYVEEGKLVQPFPLMISGPKKHFLLVKHGERRKAVVDFCKWLQGEIHQVVDS